MPGQTNIYDLPYPLQTDPIWQGANQIRALAEAVEAALAAAGIPDPAIPYRPDLVMVERTSVQSIPNTGAETPISWSSAVRNLPANSWVVGTPTRLFARRAGVFRVTGTVTFSVNSAGGRSVHIRKNGNDMYRGAGVAPSATFHSEVQQTADIPMVAGDYVEILAAHTGSAALNVVVTEHATRASMNLLYAS